MASATAKYKELKKQMSDAKKKMKDTAKAVFTELSADLFKNNPNLVSFGWAQYTPYWNDGDVCTFSALTEYPTCTIKTSDGKIVKYDENHGEYEVHDAEDDEVTYDVSREKYEKEFEKITSKVSKFLQTFDDDDFQTMFGESVEVTVKSNGKITTDSYDHE